MAGLTEPRKITNIRELINDVGTWAQQQPWHPVHAPDYGVVEEIGELYHAVLKNMQKIRGFEVEEFFLAKAKDALGDIMVYLSHWCYLKNTYYTFQTGYRVAFITGRDSAKVPMRSFAARLCTFTGHMLALDGEISGNESVCSAVASNIATACSDIAKEFGWDLMEDCVYPTWHHVRQRNWAKLQAESATKQMEHTEALARSPGTTAEGC